jgi:hypothetical protein
MHALAHSHVLVGHIPSGQQQRRVSAYKLLAMQEWART